MYKIIQYLLFGEISQRHYLIPSHTLYMLTRTFCLSDFSTACISPEHYVSYHIIINKDSKTSNKHNNIVIKMLIKKGRGLLICGVASSLFRGYSSATAVSLICSYPKLFLPSCTIIPSSLHALRSSHIAATII